MAIGDSDACWNCGHERIMHNGGCAALVPKTGGKPGEMMDCTCQGFTGPELPGGNS